MRKWKLLVLGIFDELCVLLFIPDFLRNIRQRRLFRRMADVLFPVTQCEFAWYQFSREGNSEGLRRPYARPRLKVT
jgi:hypothetical protein